MDNLVFAVDWAAVVKAAAWPVSILLAAIIVALSSRGPRWIAFLQARLSKVAALGISVELTENAARETRQTVEDAFNVIRTRVKREMDQFVKEVSLADRRATVIDGAIVATVAHNANRSQGLDIRSTIYVPDPVVNTCLYQLLDYYPKAPGERGRTISQRFGIVGRAWRSHAPEVAGHVPVGEDRRIREWGMTRAEAAERGGTRQSYLAIPLDYRGARVAVIYMDSPLADVFASNEIVESVRRGIDETNLAEDIARLNREIQSRTPGITIEY